MEGHPSGEWGFFEALMESAAEKAKQMNPGSWTFAVRQKFPTGTEVVGQHCSRAMSSPEETATW